MLSFENQNIEFKQEYVPDIRKEVMGFANAEGGTVYIGVRRDGAVVGVDDPDGVMLQVVNSLKDSLSPDVPIGLSDHTLNNNACIAALALGADLVERHFTDEMARSGPDIICSMDEAACEELIQAAIEVPMMRGGTKGALPEEQVTIDFAFATVVTIAPVKKGEVFTKENIWVKRPGTGEILAKDYTKILGKKAVEDIAADTQLKNDMVE